MPVRQLTQQKQNIETLTSLAVKGLKRKDIVDRKGRLYSSDSYCQRASALNATFKGEIERDETFPLYTGIGKTVEGIFLSAWYDVNSLAAYSIKLPENEMNLAGEIDAFVKLNGELRIIEVKTCGKKLPDYPKSMHLSQARTYAALVGMPYSVYYIGRDVADYTNGERKLATAQFDYEFDKDVLCGQILQLASAHNYIKAGFIPPIPGHIKFKQHCEDCSFKKMCWEKTFDLETIANGLTSPTPTDEIKILNESIDFVEEFMQPDKVQKRREAFYEIIRKEKQKTYNVKLLE